MKFVATWLVISAGLSAGASVHCDGCTRELRWSPAGPLQFSVTLVYGGGENGKCEEDPPGCDIVRVCKYQQITVTLTGLQGDLTGWYLASINPVVVVPYSEGPYPNGDGRKQWTIGKATDALTPMTCGLEIGLITVGDDNGGFELKLACTKCDGT